MTTNQKVLAGFGLAVVAYLAYKHYSKSAVLGKNDNDFTKDELKGCKNIQTVPCLIAPCPKICADDSTSNITGEYAESLKNLPEYNMSNASGTMCRCDNGFTGRCESGDCSKCCGTYNKRKPEQRHYKF